MADFEQLWATPWERIRTILPAQSEKIHKSILQQIFWVLLVFHIRFQKLSCKALNQRQNDSHWTSYVYKIASNGSIIRSLQITNRRLQISVKSRCTSKIIIHEYSSHRYLSYLSTDTVWWSSHDYDSDTSEGDYGRLLDSGSTESSPCDPLPQRLSGILWLLILRLQPIICWLSKIWSRVLSRVTPEAYSERKLIHCIYAWHHKSNW